MRALVLVALLCVGTVHALDDTCSTLWSKLSHLGCRPQDQLLRDHAPEAARAEAVSEVKLLPALGERKEDDAAGCGLLCGGTPPLVGLVSVEV